MLPEKNRAFSLLKAFDQSYAIVKDQVINDSEKYNGGGERVRTDDPLRARQVLSQLSYTPEYHGGPGRT